MSLPGKILRWLWSLDTRAVELFLAFEGMRRGSVWLFGLADIQSAYYASLRTVGDATFWGAVFALIGLAQVVGVIVNGSWRRSPILRIAALVVSASSYTLLAITFARSGLDAWVQASSQEALSTIVCIWCAVNISAKMGHPK